MSAVSTHVLDTAAGRPAAGVPVRLELVAPGEPSEIGRAVTDDDGRVGELGPDQLEPGCYRLVFGTGSYFDGLGDDGRRGPAFYPEVVVVFTVDGQAAHYHLPLLLSPFGYATYRGS